MSRTRDTVGYRTTEFEHTFDSFRTHRALSRCFWLVLLLHAIPIWLTFDILQKSLRDPSHLGGALAIPVAGCGVMATWFACTKRTVLERVSRLGLAVGAMLLCLAAWYRVSVASPGLLLSAYVFAGALSSAILARFATNLTLIPPIAVGRSTSNNPRDSSEQVESESTLLGTRHLMLMTATFALSFATLAAYGDLSLKRNFALQFSAILAGGVSTCCSVVAIAIVSKNRTARTLSLLALLVALAITAQSQGLLSPGRTDSVIGVAVLMTSPLVSFGLLCRCGYRYTR